MDITQILTKVLIIIDYQDDKQQFIDQFSSLCVRLAIIDAIEGLPLVQKHEVEKLVGKAKGVETMRVILQKYISEERYQDALKNTSQRLFGDYIDTIIPTLTHETKKTLLNHLLIVGKNN
jgi:hypothetical protein